MSERLSEERQQEAEVRELRQELAARAEDNLRLVGTLRCPECGRRYTYRIERKVTMSPLKEAPSQ